MGMQGIVIYKSKYGATKQYAAWLSEMLDLPIVSSDEVLKGELKKYNCVLLGTSVYFGKFKLQTWLRRNTKALINKNIFMFIVNATAPDEVKKRNNFIEHNVPAALKPYCKFHFMPGRVIHKRLSFRDKLILKLAAGFEKNPIKRKALLEDLNEVKKENLQPLVNDVRRYCTNDVAWQMHTV